jgi:HAD superfamily hydrolase (TIGR01490 family)
MTEDKTILAIFDFDGTLTTGHLWVGIAKHHQKFKIKRLNLYLYLFSHLPLWLATKAKLYSEEKNRAKWGEDLPGLFRGFSTGEAKKTFQWIVDNYFMSLMRSDVLAALNEHKKQGHKIMVLSGMFTDFLDVVGQRLGVDYVVGTKLQVVTDAYSGCIVGPLCFGENKAAFLNEFIREKRLDVDLQSSWAYADSIYDLSVFRLVGKPVATYPDNQLKSLAQDNRWQIIPQH